jgi:hypothetical protein
VPCSSSSARRGEARRLHHKGMVDHAASRSGRRGGRLASIAARCGS